MKTITIVLHVPDGVTVEVPVVDARTTTESAPTHTAPISRTLWGEKSKAMKKIVESAQNPIPAAVVGRQMEQLGYHSRNWNAELNNLERSKHIAKLRVNGSAYYKKVSV